jgi:hypothetical protein
MSSTIEELVEALGLPLFVKPARQGPLVHAKAMAASGVSYSQVIDLLIDLLIDLRSPGPAADSWVGIGPGMRKPLRSLSKYTRPQPFLNAVLALL